VTVVDFHAYASSSSGNAYLVTTEGLPPLAIECGLPIRQLRRCYPVYGLAGCLVSHFHADHSRGARDVMRAGVDVYASAATWSGLDLGGHRAHLVLPGEPLLIRGWRVLAFPLKHDAEGCLGFLIEPEVGEGRVLYACDSAYVPVRANGVTIFAIEANYSLTLLRQSTRDVEGQVRVLRNHMSIERVVEMLAANDLSSVREIWLLHMSDHHSDEAAFKAAVERATGKPTHVAPRLAPVLRSGGRA
jgi:phosphoribosyl 1,2-cyclic phosphodiesterase